MRLSPVWRKQNLDDVLGSVTDDRRFVHVRDRLVQVDRLGVGLGDPIVLVPGLAGGWRLLMPLARRLAVHHEVVLFDLAGEREPYGRRDTDRVTEDALDLAELVRKLGLEQPTILGVSYGGAVALEAVVQTPSLAGSLVLFGTAPRFEAGIGAQITRRVLERFPLPSSSPFLNQFFNVLHGGRPRSERLAEFVAERCWETDPGVVVARLRSLETYDVTDRLWRVEAPTLVVAGERDVVVPPAEQKELAERIAGARFVRLNEAGHIGFLTHGPELRDLVVELIGGRQNAVL